MTRARTYALLLVLAVVIPTALGDGSMPMLLAAVLVTALAVAVACTRRSDAGPALRTSTLRLADAVLPLVKQDDPDAAGHIRSRAPGLSRTTC